MNFFRQRVICPEYLDHAPPEEARLNLAEIVRLNQRFGGHAIVRRLLEKTLKGRTTFTLLDIGAASGDTARLIAELYPQATVMSLDANEVNLENAPQPKLLADAFHLPFEEGAVDYVFCSLFLHHFTDDLVIELLRKFFFVARRALLISDLERNVLPYLFLPLSKPILGWSAMTVHDGMTSVRAAFTGEEMKTLGAAAGIPSMQIEYHRPAFRISALAEKS